VCSRQIWSQLEPVMLPLFAYRSPLVPLMFFTLKCEFMVAIRHPEKGERSSQPLQGLARTPFISEEFSTFFANAPSSMARTRASAPLRPAPGASEDGAAPNHLSICHRPARPFRRAP